MARETRLLIVLGGKSLKKAGRNLISEAKKHFDSVLAVPISKIRVEISGGKAKLFYKNADLTTFDACFARLFADDYLMGEVLLDVLEASGVYLPGTLEGFQVSNHKYFTVKILSKMGIRLPVTGFCASPLPAGRIIGKLSFPVVAKLLAGFGGKGVMLVQNQGDFKPLLETMDVLKEFIVTQEFIKNAGHDVRCYVVGENVYGVKRTAAKGDWRTNLSRGGTAEEIELSQEYKELALKAAKAIGLDICAVDFLDSDMGPVLIEINYTPGMMVKFFDKKYAGIFIGHIYRKALERKQSS